MPRCDLQVHSSFSDRPSEWVLRQLGMPESYTKPEELYQKLKSKGFDYVTITDHNCINGCLEIAEGRDDVFLSEEVTTYFPEDGCKVHVLTWGITEQQHEAISRVRRDIYDLVAYLREEKIVHGVAHPLFSINQRLTVEHFEKLILLFQVFEGLNGTREPLAQEVATLCLSALTPELIFELAEKHDLEPVYPEAWRKSLTGGSDDHGGLYPGETWTEVEGGRGYRDFLEKVSVGECRPAGAGGNALKFSSSIYNVVFSYARDRLKQKAPRGVDLLQKIAQRFLDGKNPVQFSFTERVGLIAEAVRSGKAFDFLKPPSIDASLNRQITEYFMNPKVIEGLDQIIASEQNPSRRTFLMTSKIANDLSFKLFLAFLERLEKGELMESLQPLSGFIPVGVGITPYLFAFHSLHGNRPLLERTAKRFLKTQPKSLQNTKRAWFTDTLEDVNGVARTIRTMSLSAKKAGKDVMVITSRSEITIDDIDIKNFEAVGEFELPEYELQKLSFPPILEMIDYIEREGFTECIISTPGPVGITALVAAKLLGLRTSGIYHTDFPQYVKILTEDEVLETVMWKFMHWFYSQLDLVYVNSEFYKQCWIQRGIPGSKIKILPRGLDTELFNTKHRDEDFWKQRGAQGKVLLYVGRVSKEKDLGFLVDVYRSLEKSEENVTLAVVGEGPYREEMERLLPKALFTGILSGETLGQAYASADLFVFPSTTDTFGNVVIEAMAAGLPVYVSDIGGPKELVGDYSHCRILKANHLESWKDALTSFLESPVSRDVLEETSARMRAERSWDRAFEQFWREGFEE